VRVVTSPRAEITLIAGTAVVQTDAIAGTLHLILSIDFYSVMLMSSAIGHSLANLPVHFGSIIGTFECVDRTPHYSRQFAHFSSWTHASGVRFENKKHNAKKPGNGMLD
jgi:hypothetical protein